MDDKRDTKNLKQLKEELQRQTEQILHEKFTWQTVERWILDLLQKRVEDIAMAALGYRWDDGHWGLDKHKEGGVQKIMTQLAEHVAAKHLPKMLARCQKEIEKKLSSPRSVREYANVYECAIQCALDNKVEAWVKKNTEFAVDQLFERNCEKFLEEIKLTHKLTMQSLTLLAESDEEEEGEEED